MPEWHGFSGLLSYSYMVGNAWYPVTGGLFLGDDAEAAATQTHRPFSGFAGPAQHRSRPRPSIRLSRASGSRSACSTTPACRSNLSAIRISAARIRTAGPEPHQLRTADESFRRFMFNASAGADIYKSDRLNMRFQVDGQNLTNVLNVIDFGGLFSGNAIGPSRSFGMRLSTNF